MVSENAGSSRYSGSRASTSEADLLPAVDRGTLFFPLCLPTVGVGLIFVILSITLFQEKSAALLVFAGSLIGLFITFCLFRQMINATESVLRNPDLREADLTSTGVFQPVLGELVSLIQIHESECRKLADQRTRAEVRSHHLRSQTRRMEQALDQLDQPVFVFDTIESLSFHNHAARNLMEDATGDPSLPASVAWQHLSGLSSLVSLVQSRSAAADRRTAELSLKCEGESGTFHARAANLYDDDGRLSGVAAVLSDVSKVSHEKNRHAEFVSSVSHELKTPLASIRAYTELLMDDDVDNPDERHELLLFIEEQVDRLTRLVNNLLNFARIESGVIPVHREDTDVNRVLKKSLDVVQGAASEKEISLISELSDLYLPAQLDVDLFGQAIINLLSNAVKYTPEGGEVRLRSRMLETEALIEVIDNGMGIPSESLPRLFERFYRVPENAKAAPGTGLGLALVKYIVASIHDGSISVTSQVQRGSTFAVRVPLGHRGRSLKRLETAEPQMA